MDKKDLRKYGITGVTEVIYNPSYDELYREETKKGLRGGEDAVEEKALENTIQCFEDGIFRVFAEDTELTALEEAIPWKDDLIFTFIRLTMLSGW